MRYHYTTLLLLLFSLTFLSCSQTPTSSKPLTIGISKERKSEKKYSDWLANQGVPFTFIDLSQARDALASLDSCDALLLTGGNDIYPAYYEKEFDTLRCGVFDHRRDSLEMLLFRTAVDKNMPVLGICRGLQLINVAMGGSLFVDLPEDYGSGDLHRQGEEGWSNHQIIIHENSLLDKLQSDTMPFVASNHHQGIEKLAEPLKVIAWSIPDSLPEAISWKNPGGKGFLLAVQWHPEWMDKSDTLSSKIAGIFFEVASNKKQGSR